MTKQLFQVFFGLSFNKEKMVIDVISFGNILFIERNGIKGLSVSCMNDLNKADTHSMIWSTSFLVI